MLRYRRGPESDPFWDIFSSEGWLSKYDPPREFPFFVNVEPSNRCQLDCLFCSRQLSNRSLGDMDLRLAERIFREMALYPGAAARLAGWGEPLIHQGIVELVALAKKERVRVKMYTNGLLLTQDTMAGLMEAGLDELQFSMQGLNEDQYRFNRVNGSWQRLADNIIMASRARGSRARPFLSVLTSVLQSELEEASPAKFCDYWLQFADKVAVDLTSLNFVRDLPRVKPVLPAQSPKLTRGRCVDVFLALEVKYDGFIQYCGQDSQGLAEHTIGKLGYITLKEAWDSPKMREKRSRVGRSLDHAAFQVCKNCFHNTSKYDLFKALEEKRGGGAKGG